VELLCTVSMRTNKWTPGRLDSVGQCFSTFPVKRNPMQQSWLLTEPNGTLEARRAEIRGSKPPHHHQLEVLWALWAPTARFGVEPRPQIYFGSTKSLENMSSGRKCRTQFNFFTEHRLSCRTLGYHWQNPCVPQNPGWKTLVQGVVLLGEPNYKIIY